MTTKRHPDIELPSVWERRYQHSVKDPRIKDTNRISRLEWQSRRILKYMRPGTVKRGRLRPDVLRIIDRVEYDLERQQTRAREREQLLRAATIMEFRRRE